MSSVGNLPIQEFRERFGLRHFVETGCYLGDAVQASLHAGFECATSCDVSELHIDRCRTRFAGNRQVTLVQSDSLNFLESLRVTNREPTLFWLDAHFPGYYGFEAIERTVGRFPLLDELRILSSLDGIDRDVILCDDLRVVADEANPRWRPGEQGEEWHIKDLPFADLLATLRDTHEAQVLMQEEGILAFFPRVN